MSKSPSVSVLLPTYECSNYIEQAIDSLLAQSFADFEIIIVDDGSTDDTIDRIARFTDPRITLHRFGINRGLSAALNYAMERASGRFIARLDADDWALPERLMIQANYLDRHAEVSAVFGMPRFVDERGSPILLPPSFHGGLALPDFNPSSWLRQFFVHGNCLAHPTAMIRRHALVNVQGYDPRLNVLADLDLWVGFAMAGAIIHVMPDTLIAYRLRDNDGNMSAPSRSAIRQHNYEYFQILKRFWTLDVSSFSAVFRDIITLSSDPVQNMINMAEFSLSINTPAHKLLALETYFKFSGKGADFRRLIDLSSSTDLFSNGP